MSEFYFNLSKNVAFGAEGSEARKPEKQKAESKIPMESANPKEENRGESETSVGSKERSESIEAKKPVVDTQNKQEVSNDSLKEESGKDDMASQPATADHHKRNQDALAAAKERFLARKKTKVNVD